MRDYRFVNLEEFLTVADSFGTALKVFEVEDNLIHSEVYLRTAVVTNYSPKTEENLKKLKEHGFCEVKILETKRIILEDLL
jgi:hypothetical protein